jgi:hypothetical protein
LPVRGRRLVRLTHDQAPCETRLFHGHVVRRRVVKTGVATIRVLFILLWFKQYVAFFIHLFPFCRSRSGRGSGEFTLGDGRRLGHLLFRGHGGRSL